jgi:hypothetical protein
MATAYLLAGDEDLREGVVAAQELGIRVVVLGIENPKGNQAPTLIMEADDHLILPKTFWAPYFSLVAGAVSKISGMAPATPPAVASVPTSVGLDKEQMPITDREARQAFLLGQDYGRTWGLNALPEQFILIRNILTHLRLPRELDAELIKFAQRVMGPLFDKPTLRHNLREGFWVGLKEAIRDMTGHPKARYVRSYLTTALPNSSVEEFEWVERDSWAFRIRNGRAKHKLLVSREFLDDTPEGEIESTLGAWKVADVLKKAGDEWVLVTNSGTRIGLP